MPEWRVRMKRLRLAVAAALATFDLSACRSATAPVSPAPQAMTMEALHRSGGVPPGWKFSLPPGDVAAGRRAFVDFGCHTCHDVRGEQFPAVAAGEKRPGPDLAGMGSHHPAEYFTESILNPNAVLVDGPGYLGPDGRSVMPAYPDMTLAQLANLVAYLQSLTAGADMRPHAHHMFSPAATGGAAPAPPEAAVFLVEVNEVSREQLRAFDDWFVQRGMDDLKNFTGLVSLQTFVNRAVGRRQLVTVFGFADEAALEDFRTQAQVADAPAEIRALVRPGKGSVYHSSVLYHAPGLSLP
jgi:mono/diheme cytochrome c family protein